LLNVVVPVDALPAIAMWMKVGELGRVEKEILGMVVGSQDTSRLSCQIKVTEELDGLVVRLPKSQY